MYGGNNILVELYMAEILYNAALFVSFPKSTIGDVMLVV